MGRRQYEGTSHTSCRRWALCTWPVVFAFVAGCSSVNRTAEVVAPAAPAREPALRSEDSASRLNGHRTCGTALRDAFTKPWYGNYLGPDNFGFDKPPIDELDAAAREHDLAYGRFHLAGVPGALWCLDGGRADFQLAKRAFQALPSLDFSGKLMGVATGITMGCLGVVKVPIAEIRDAVHHKSEPPIPSPTS